MINQKTKTKPSIIHSPGMSNPYYYKTNSFWPHALKISNKISSIKKGNLEIILCNNLKNPLTELNLKKIGIEYTVLGKEIKQWNNIYKVKLIKDYLYKTKSKFILYLDSTDVLIIRDLEETILSKKSCKMLFNAEVKFYPSCKSLYKEEEFEKSISPNEYFALNAGCWIAEVDFLKKVIVDFINIDKKIDKYIDANESLNKEKIINSDQFRWHILYKKNYPNIKIDNMCDFFQNIFLHSEKDFGPYAKKFI